MKHSFIIGADGASNVEQQAPSVSAEERSANNQVAKAATAMVDGGSTSTPDSQSKQLAEIDSQARETIALDLRNKGCMSYELTVTSFLAIRKYGYLFVTTPSNRAINRAQVKALKSDLKKRGVKKFTTPILTCSAKVALQLGVQLEDIDGNPVDATHPDINRMLLVLDGQHRLVVLLSENDIDADVNIAPCPDNVAEHVKTLNSFDLKWKTSDYRAQISVIKNKVDNLKVAELEARKIFPKASEKYINYAIMQVREAVRKGQILKGELPEFDEANAQFGLELHKTIRLVNPDGKNNGFTNLPMLDMVFEAKKVFNSKKGVDTEFLKFFKLYLGQVNPRDFDIKDKEKKKERIQAFIDNIPKDFKSFVTKNSTIDVDTLNAINEKIDKIVAGGTAEHYQPETSNVHDLVAEIVGERKKREDLEREKKELDELIKELKLKSKSINNALKKA